MGSRGQGAVGRYGWVRGFGFGVIAHRPVSGLRVPSFGSRPIPFFSMPTTSSRPPQLPAVLCRHFEVVNGRKGRALVGAGGWWRQAGGLTETSSLKRCYQQTDEATMLEVVLGGGQLRESRG